MFDIQKYATIKEEGIGMQKYLPSKIFIAVMASALFIMGGGYFVFFRARTPQKSIVAQKTAERNEQASLFAAKDTDGDGLKDWEEVLWSTDPNKEDTDGDGTKDNEEILARRDPAKVGPDDSIDVLAQKIDASSASSEEAKPQTLTESLARDFGEAYMRQKFGKEAVDEDYLSKLLFFGITDGLAKGNVQQPQEYFSQNDFIISLDSSSSAIRDYLNKIGLLFSQNASTPQKSELQFALETILEGDLTQLNQLLVYRDAYRNIAEGMRDISVPAVMAQAHQDMANSFVKLGLIAEQMSKFEEDPMGSFAAFNAYLLEAQLSIEPLKVIVHEIKARDLLFKNEEGGSVFIRYLTKI